MAIRQHLHSGVNVSAAHCWRATIAHHIDQPVRRLVKHAAKDCERQACDANVSYLTVRRQALRTGQTGAHALALPAAFSALSAGTADREASAPYAAQQPALCSAPGSVSSTTCCNEPNSMSWHWMMSM